MQQEAGRCLVSSLVLGIAVVIAVPTTGWAHGVVGKRWFPSTVVVEDPFVSDEASFVVSHIKGPEGRETELEAEITKRLSPNFAIGFGGSYRIVNSLNPDEPNAYGFSNPEISLRYQFFRDPVHEVASTIALNIDRKSVV